MWMISWTDNTGGHKIILRLNQLKAFIESHNLKAFTAEWIEDVP